MPTKDLFEYDLAFAPLVVAGMDEAGRGPLAGPVVCAVCIMPSDVYIDKINDSKKLSEKLRNELYEKILASSHDYKIVAVDNETIDKINILNATKLGMKRAVEGLKIKPDILLVDAVPSLDIDVKYNSIIKGDAISYNIAAASILAKVYRDRLMKEYDALYPQYGFKDNKGYGTKEHIEALKKYGKCALHRDSFIKNFISKPLYEQVEFELG